MASVPPFILNSLKNIPAEGLEKMCAMTKVEVGAERLTSKSLIAILESGDILKIRRLYAAIAPVLMVGGMIPVVGLAFNLVDAACCYCLGLWFDFAIDALAIALTEVPGISGVKGVSRTMLSLCKNIRIDAKMFWCVIERIEKCGLLREGKIHQLFTILMDESNKMIEFVDVKSIYQSISRQNFYRWGNRILEKVGEECKACMGEATKRRAISLGQEIKTQTAVGKVNTVYSQLLSVTAKNL